MRNSIPKCDHNQTSAERVLSGGGHPPSRAAGGSIHKISCSECEGVCYEYSNGSHVWRSRWVRSQELTARIAKLQESHDRIEEELRKIAENESWCGWYEGHTKWNYATNLPEVVGTLPREKEVTKRFYELKTKLHELRKAIKANIDPNSISA